MILLGVGVARGQIAAVTGFCQQGATPASTSGLKSTNTLQGLIPQCTVTVFLTGTSSIATIFADGNSTPLSNPFTATTKAKWSFFAAINQGYDVVLSGGILPNTYATPETLVGLFPSQQIISTPGAPGPPGPPGSSANITGQAGGVIPLATNSTSIGAQSHLDDGVTAASTITSTEPFATPSILATTNNWTTPTICGSSSNPASMFCGQQNGTPADVGTTSQLTTGYELNSSTPGFSCSFPGFGCQGWQITKSAEVQQDVNGSGIAQSLSIVMHKYGIGDAQAVEATAICSGGWTAANDEQCKVISGNAFEDGAQGGAGVYTGTCATGCTAGSTQIKTTPVNNPKSPGTWRYVIDTSQSPISTTVSNIVAGLDPTHMSASTVAASVTASTAWGTLAGNVATPLNTIPPFTTSETFNVNVQSGTFTAPGFGCFASSFHDQALITAVGTPSGGVQSVTVAAHRQHASGGEFFEGGMCGTFIEFTAYTLSSGGSTYRYLYDIVGSTDTHTLQGVIWWTGSAQPFSKFPNNFIPTTLYGCFNAGTLTNSGTTTITGTVSSFCSPSYGGVTQFNQATLFISGSSDTALNGNCTASTWSDSTHFTCTQAGLSGTHTGTGAAVQLSSTGVNGLNNVNIWPGAAVLDVQDETTTPPAVNGALTIEPNNIAFAPGDTIEEPHHITQELQGLFISQSPLNAITQFGNAASIGMGNRAQGGGTSTVSNAALALSGGGTDSNYLGFGGWWIAPNAINFTHVYNTYLNADHAPQPNSSFINIAPVTVQKNDVNSCYFLFSMTHLSGVQAQWKDCPNSGSDTITTGGNFLLNPTGTATYTASSHIFNNAASFNGNITLNGAANAISGANLSTTGGLLSGQGQNYAPFSNTLTAATWALSAGTGTETCAITDDLLDPACTLTQTSVASFAWHDSNIGGLTPLTLSTSYVTQARMRGHSGGELVTLGGDQQGSNVFLTTSWANYCVTYVASASGASLNHTAGINLNANGAAIDVANVVTAPGTTCTPPPLPLATLNNQFIVQTNINHAGSFDANAYTLAGAAQSTVGGLPVVIAAGTAAMTTAAITAPACGTTVTVASTGVLTTDAITWSFNAAPAGTNAGLVSWPTSGNVNFAYCPGVTETPASATINWRVER